MPGVLAMCLVRVMHKAVVLCVGDVAKVGCVLLCVVLWFVLVGCVYRARSLFVRKFSFFVSVFVFYVSGASAMGVAQLR